MSETLAVICSGIRNGYQDRAPYQYMNVAVQMTCHQRMFQSLNVRGANRMRGEEGGGGTIHFEDGRGFEVRSSRFRNFEPGTSIRVFRAHLALHAPTWATGDRWRVVWRGDGPAGPCRLSDRLDSA